MEMELEIDIRKKYPGTFLGPSPLNAMRCDSANCINGFSNEANNQCHSLRSDVQEMELPVSHRLARDPQGKVDREWMYELFEFK